MFKVKSKGNYSKATKYLAKIQKPIDIDFLEKYGREGVEALKKATPVNTGLTRDSWYYKIVKVENRYTIQFCNSNVADYVPIAIILQYGHATRNGGWVEGIDYINPAIQPVFDKLAKNAWEEVTNV